MALIQASAPSNIALVKYMGKSDTASNRPTNASLSFTLDKLRTTVQLEPGAREDCWKSLEGATPMKLSDKGREKFLNHFRRCKTRFEINEACTVSSANNFPSDCGLASSASSFAALTKATYELARQIRPELNISDEELSALSRQGSGSSCRSFFSPWAVWRGEGAEAIEIPQRFEHAVIIVEDSIKAVSSSEAHKRVLTSALFQGRPERAELRLRDLTASLRTGDWARSYELCWTEFWDMHALFETSQPSFGYFTPGTFAVLKRAREIWQDEKDGPLVTMDAGPNVHFLLRPDQIARAEHWLEGFHALTSWDMP